MSEQVELKFHIDAFTPDTIPMRTLVDYLRDLSVILGEFHSVHFNRVEGGSTSPVLRVDVEALQAVRNRANAVRMNDAPMDAILAKRRLEKRLTEHNASGADLLDFKSGERILHFRGRGSPQEVYGPVRQAAELIGCVMMIGGISDPVPVHLRDVDRNYVCEAKLDVAKRLRAHLFETPIRASGYGTYFRNDQGEWEMQKFRIADFETLDPTGFVGLLEEMRKVKPAWLEGADPLAVFRDDD